MTTLIGFGLVVIAIIVAFVLGSAAARSVREFREEEHVSFITNGNGNGKNGKSHAMGRK